MYSSAQTTRRIPSLERTFCRSRLIEFTAISRQQQLVLSTTLHKQHVTLQAQ